MPLSIDSLTLHHFRNYAFAELQTHGRSIILSGANGSGKTNLLEAISLLSPGKGFRKAKLSEMTYIPSPAGAAKEPEEWVIAADCAGLQGAVHLGTALDGESATERRLIKIDGAKAKSQSALAEHLAISWHTPQMDGLFLASDGDRRRYLDRMIYSFDAEHLPRVTHYEHAMRERNRLLSNYPYDAAWLAALEEQMASGAAAIAHSRLELLDRLTQAIGAAGGEFPKAQLAMEGEVESLVLAHNAAEAEAQMKAALVASRRRDAASGRALYGSHRSRLLVVHSEKQMPAAQCSTGEQKALLLSILLAHAAAMKDWRGAAPILLLDETVAHLDFERRAALAQRIAALQAQTFVTGTDAADFEAFEAFADHYAVEAGQLKRQR